MPCRTQLGSLLDREAKRLESWDLELWDEVRALAEERIEAQARAHEQMVGALGDLVCEFERRHKGSQRAVPLRPLDDTLEVMRYATGNIRCALEPGRGRWGRRRRWTCMGNNCHHLELVAARLDGGPERLEADWGDTSDRTPCSGAAVVVDGFSWLPDTGFIFVCAAHDGWLHRHDIVDGMDSGHEAERDATGWRLLGPPNSPLRRALSEGARDHLPAEPLGDAIDLEARQALRTGYAGRP